jgi:selenocysteine lyase/cysteine desulfurase
LDAADRPGLLNFSWQGYWIIFSKKYLCEKTRIMLTCQRGLFKIPDEIAYLNCAYMSPQLRQVEVAGRDMLALKNSPWLITTAHFFDPLKELKALFALLINIREKDRIAIVPSVSYGMATVAKNIQIAQGQRVIVAEGQFPSNYYPWERICRENGGEIVAVGVPDGPDRGARWNQAILDAIDHRTRLVALGHVHWADGTLFDLMAIRQRTREVGALLVIDGTQSVGALPFDASLIQPDALVCAGYKWLMGPYSIGLAYYGPVFDNGTPIEENWINRRDSEDFAGLVSYREDYQPFAGRYSMGEQSQFILGPMLKTALEQILDWEVAEIQAYCSALMEGAVESLAEMGCWVEAPAWRGAHLIGVRLGKHIAPDLLKAALAEQKVMVSFRGDAVRVAPHVYNTEEDVQHLLAAFRGSLR